MMMRPQHYYPKRTTTATAADVVDDNDDDDRQRRRNPTYRISACRVDFRFGAGGDIVAPLFLLMRQQHCKLLSATVQKTAGHGRCPSSPLASVDGPRDESALRRTEKRKADSTLLNQTTASPLALCSPRREIPPVSRHKNL